MYTGLIIKESIADDTLLDYIRIIGVEIWKTDNTPRYWTAVSFTSECGDFPEKLSKAIKTSCEGEVVWYVDFQDEKHKYIVLKDTILKYRHGDKEGKHAVCQKCIEAGIKKEQLDWSE